MSLFKKLSRAEEDEYKDWAWDNWTPGKPCNSVWHPVIAAEWRRLQAAHDEASQSGQ